eukprot:gnl/TRDRNA2_/TRDRNA2_44986_c0_seq1.p1 gnl/TRDRNA2_/TRDRNA2_44986_c0~~gnl/TRDRNA2_/TRDRNA2_44986_c0_seq1.p1  ORF type:complete len:355 (+),score=65.30 gnl/TRDRNA2_/TRDRNA2_44986_c0_seq1:80-1144(+)
MAGNEDKGKTACGCCVITAVILGMLWLCWRNFAADLDFYNNQKPALCLDGRRDNDTVSAVKFKVDDTKIHKNVVTMRCFFPVAVYPCAEEGCSFSNEEPLLEMPLMERDAGMDCVQPGAPNLFGGMGSCDDKDGFNCATGKCTGYEKAKRMCAGKIRLEKYPCWYAEDDIAAQVRDEEANWPVAWLIGGILVSLAVLCAVVACVAMIVADEDPGGTAAQCIAITLCNVVIYGIIWAIVWALTQRNKQKPRGQIDASYQEFTIAEMGNRTYVPPEEPPDEMEWWEVVLIIFGTFLGAVCLFGCCLFCYALLCSPDEEAQKSRGLATAPSDSQELLSSEDDEEDEDEESQPFSRTC